MKTINLIKTFIFIIILMLSQKSYSQTVALDTIFLHDYDQVLIDNVDSNTLIELHLSDTNDSDVLDTAFLFKVGLGLNMFHDYASILCNNYGLIIYHNYEVPMHVRVVLTNSVGINDYVSNKKHNHLIKNIYELSGKIVNKNSKLNENQIYIYKYKDGCVEKKLKEICN